VLRKLGAGSCGWLASALLAAPACCGALPDAPAIIPQHLPPIAAVDARFQSYNIEMIEITGGKFWKPYRSRPGDRMSPPQSASDTPPGMDSSLYQYRPPIDLTDMRLRKLAAALGPAYLRVSGTWANSTYFADSDHAPPDPPAGFNGVLTRPQWRGAVDFAQAVDARIVTSFAVSAGSRDAAGIWKQATPDTALLGPGTVGEGTVASDLLAASGAEIDAVSYHYYGTLSQRCIGTGAPEAALSEDWLSRTDRTLAFYKTLRDRFAPGKPIWLTETAEAACGGNPWAASFLDTFRYLDQLGRLARAGVQVVMHNTLAASDYGLLDETTLTPRPDYWGALLWRQLMGTTVLDAGVSIESGLHVYAHCQRAAPGGVALLVINPDRDAAHALMLPAASVRYTLDAANVLDEQVRLNGHPLTLSADDELPAITGEATAADTMSFAPASITFLALPAAGNSACR